jgi:2-oxoglutarate ferredoxin oxidoreductase subunit alpha
MASFGEGYRYHVTGLTHDEAGFPTSKPKEIEAKLNKLNNKIMRYLDDICMIEHDGMEDAHVAVFSYGIVARATHQAVQMAREKRMKVGQVRPITIWPAYDAKYKEILSAKSLKTIIVAELNQGQIINEVQRLAPKNVEVVGLTRYDSELITPMQILNKIKEVK